MEGAGWLLIAVATEAVIVLVAMPRRAALQLQLVAIAAAVIGLAMLNSSRAADYDPGGSPLAAMAEITAARQRGETVEIRGICYSSCALKLAARGKMCVSPTSQIGVHEVRQASMPLGYQGGIRDNLWTGFFQGMLPTCARNLFNSRQGFDSGRLTVVAGYQILAACPTIPACAG